MNVINTYVHVYTAENECTQCTQHSVEDYPE